ncbi:hypothetical protein C6495_14555 [Candidatus Poribacteria bacterium]|nr:MAG: hypothetical protein C6495_14555 [Candidatus Poribacteria bacterium]
MDNETREILEAQGNRLTKLEVQTAPIPQMQADLKETQADVKQTQADVKQTQADGKQTQEDVKQTQEDVKQTQEDVADVKINVAWIRGMLEERARNEVNAHQAKTRLGMWIFGGVASLSALLNVIQWLLSIRPSP